MFRGTMILVGAAAGALALAGCADERSPENPPPSSTAVTNQAPTQVANAETVVTLEARGAPLEGQYYYSATEVSPVMTFTATGLFTQTFQFGPLTVPVPHILAVSATSDAGSCRIIVNGVERESHRATDSPDRIARCMVTTP